MLLRLNILAFVLGASLLQQQPELPEIKWCGSLLLIGIAVALLRRYQLPILVALKNILVWGIFLGLGFFWATAFAHWRLADFLPPDWEQRDIQVIGVIATLPHSHDHGSRFQFNVEQVMHESAIIPKRILLSWYKNSQLNDHDKTQPVFEAGQRWQLWVRLKQPHGNANPHGSDYEAWLLERNIRATGYIRSSADNRLLQPMVNLPSYWIEYIRGDIQHRFSTVLANRPYAGVLKTLATGDQYAIPRDQWQVFARTGTIHLMAISGLHITLVSSLVFATVFRLWSASAHLLLRMPARRAAVIAGLLAALVYALLSGFAIPAQRSLYMLSVVAMAIWRGQLTTPLNVLIWALFWVVLFDPWSTIAPGFWLSFGAIAIIMLVSAGRIGSSHWFGNWMRVQWAITVGLIPLLLALFQQVSLISPIANALSIPLISFLIVPLALVAVIPWFDSALLAGHEVLSMLMAVLNWLSLLPHVVWEQHAPPLWTIIVAVLGIVWMLLPGSLGFGFFAGFPARWLGVFAFLPMLILQPPRPGNGELWLTVLDVGQGLAVLARTTNYALLFDTGPRFSNTDSGARIIAPYLRGEGIRQLDALIVSHADIDHSGGALSLLTAMPVGTLISSLDGQHPIHQAALHKIKCHAGQSWQWDDVNFEILHPLADDYRNSSNSTNANSCVLKISSRHGNVLLPSDIGNRNEAALLDRAADKLAATVLIAPHHGSNTSSSKTFIEKVNPSLTIFTVGYHNRHRHPRETVIARYRNQGSELLRSDKEGAITVLFANNRWSVNRWRKIYRRYWQHRLNELPHSNLSLSIDT
ncbi:MAG: DNA internalization-related competence protein ComEC/Rec2 [Nitrosomonas sp.]|nr:MAG: DNA internalization-related competence protein ComEC/Rec2 [Nitrosomonas sp.]